MKNFILTAPIVLLLSMFSFNANLEAAGCRSHKSKNVQVECSLSDDNCENSIKDKKSNKVEV